MGMNKKIVSIFSSFILLSLFLSIVGSTSAQIQGLAGVSVGQTFTYSNSYIWNSTNPAEIAPANLFLINQSQVKITVQTSTGSTIQHDDVWTYRNGTVSAPVTVTDEVNSHFTPNTIFFYAANLSAGSLLFPGATDLPFLINDTTFRAYDVNVFRETNHIAVNTTGIEGEIYSYMNLYFDKQTGCLVEYFLTTVYTDLPNQTVTQHIALTDSNVWALSSYSSPSPSSLPTSSPPSNQTPSPSSTTSSNSTESSPISLIITIVVVAVVIIVAGFLLLRKGKPKQEPEASAPPEESSYSI
jgi:hypothetical protein